MKKYLREKRKWVSEEEYNKFHAKRDKSLCRGKRSHDFVLMLPRWGVKWDGKSPYNAELYYKSDQDITDFVKKQEEKLAKNGIIVSRNRFPIRKLYICSVCKKEEYR